MPVSRLKPQLVGRNNFSFTQQQADLSFQPGFLTVADADRLNDSLDDSRGFAWRHDDIVMFGRSIAQPRLTAWVADPGITYRYSGLTLTPAQWTSELSRLRQRLQDELGAPFNSVLLNLYRDGNDTMGWHRDNEPELGDNPVIASVSLGQSRYFDVRHRCYRDLEIAPLRFELHHGDLLVMAGQTQQHWQHRVPRQRSQSGCRINLSFRYTARRD
ncbi:MAG: alpha-ketoglutarate-dependent dioxygenase AlkB [Gammaproteobacteria bacterium]|nr:alpha-ketoglutarate-dependent dioxygenase AlkB [Gammaproteobacteria bacterium]